MNTLFRHGIGIVFIFIAHLSQAQGFMESQIVPPTKDGILYIYGQESYQMDERIPYERIKGSPFWKDEFQLATLLDKYNRKLIKAPAKLNLLTNEVYFINPQGEVRVPNAGLVAKVLFHSNDTGIQSVIVFENNLPVLVETNPNAANPPFVQVINNGSVQLLKYRKVQIAKADSLFGTLKRYYFSSQTIYFLNRDNGQTIKLRKLNEETVTDQLKPDADERTWIKMNRLNLKKEEDVIQFLNYLNTRRKPIS
ncbi:MAG: hypothetical protein RL732_776 [Bacteroidota bacterium]